MRLGTAGDGDGRRVMGWVELERVAHGGPSGLQILGMEIIFRDEIRRFVIGLSQFTNGSGVRFVGLCKKAPKLHVLDQTFAQNAHGRPPEGFGLCPGGGHGGSTMLPYRSQLNRGEPCRDSGSVQPGAESDRRKPNFASRLASCWA